jgi:hypothetical protein
VISDEDARRFAAEWIEAWNAHDLDAIVGHYSDDVEFFSPVVVRLTGDSGGRLQGKEAVRSYFTRGLEAYPDLHFELLAVLVGIGSVVLSYRSIGGRLAAEVMELDGSGHVVRVLCHYAEAGDP